MRSMTGFGVGEAPLAGGRVVVETRSVNHRFLEVRVNVPAELQPHAFALDQRVRKPLGRGRIEVTARLFGPALPAPELDVDRARAAFSALAELRDELAPGTDLPLELLAAVPELFRVATEPEHEAARRALEVALDAAVAALMTMRSREGEALAADLRGHLEQSRRISEAIQQLTAEVVEAFRRRLQGRMAAMLEAVDAELDPGRLEAEVALLADRCDVSEELARLASHVDQFGELLSASEPVGRTLEFLLQEMAREANTIASKSPDARLTQHAVSLKACIERLREQVQNVE
ncbi:MAG: YicC family protein [Deltaproteobacteria bacterium]|jgi:uncharacterized protein (TIGR00255 family)|nr:YicC family protein [Deltaproteobacteria bacterium]MBW2536713.1 YicC family protein [Deltaproteobacteria bacterium]